MYMGAHLCSLLFLNRETLGGRDGSVLTLVVIVVTTLFLVLSIHLL